MEQNHFKGQIVYINSNDSNFGLVYNSIWEPIDYLMSEDWIDDSDDLHRYIDFGNQQQSVSKDFYDWLNANATKL